VSVVVCLRDLDRSDAQRLLQARRFLLRVLVTVWRSC